MIDITTQLKKSYADVQMKSLLYNNLIFYRRKDFWILIFMVITGGSMLFLTYDLEYSQLYLLLYVVAVSLGGFMIANNDAKKRLERKKICVDRNIFVIWDSESYQNEKINAFYKSLISSGLLRDSDCDIKLIEEYENWCEAESSFFKVNQSYLLGGGILILFILPVWSESISLLLKEYNDKNFFEGLKLIGSFLAAIGLVIYLLSMFDKALLEFTNSTSRKYKSISRLLILLRLNLIIKYSDSKKYSLKEEVNI